MLGRVRTAVAQLVGGLGPTPGAQRPRDSPASPPAPPGPSACRGPPAGGGGFSRPAFLQLSSEELQRADDHAGRAVQSPRETRRRLPWSTGYPACPGRTAGRSALPARGCPAPELRGRELGRGVPRGSREP
uniref:Uncharacterized protein n=1 Tax=Chelydra serpentina TaxID=8475 RepID=A0A8C3RW84_CHESE